MNYEKERDEAAEKRAESKDENGEYPLDRASARLDFKAGTDWANARGQKFIDELVANARPHPDHLVATKLASAQQEIAVLKEKLNTLVEIVDVAFYDHHTAGTMPGSGYQHRVYSKISQIFGWRNDKKWKAFKEALKPREDGRGE